MRAFMRVLAAVVLVAGCSDDDNGGGGDLTELNGIVNTDDGSATGSLFVEVEATGLLRSAHTSSGVAASRAPVLATGNVTMFGGITDLTGGYDAETGILTLEGGGYSFNGIYDGETITGTWNGPNFTEGTFVAAPGEGVAFCGTFLVYTEEPNEEGTFSFVVVGTAAWGQATAEDGSSIPLVGELTGPLATAGVNIAFFAPGTSTVFASGTINSTSTEGGFNVPDGEGGFESGNWTGSPAFCDGQT